MPGKRVLAILGLTLMLALPLPAAAGGTQCNFQPDIIALSDYVLKNRGALTRFKGLRYGAISAFLKLRYQKLPPDAVEAMLMPLVEARVSRADELMFTWAIHTYGVDAAIAVAGPKTAKLLFAGGYSASVLRAAVAKEGLKAFEEQLGDARPEDRLRAEAALASGLFDKFDTYKAELGKQAEATGYLQLAAGLAAMQSDPKAFEEFGARTKDKDLLQRIISYWRWAPGLVGNPALDGTPVDADAQMSRDRFHRIMIASAMTPERSFLTTYVNHSGRLEEAGKAAETVVTLASDKSAGPWTMERAWIATYLELLTVTDDAKTVDATLAAIPFGGIRHYDGSVRDVLDWMIAADALKPYVLGQSEVKAEPELISANFKRWPVWQAAADAIRGGADLAPQRSSGDSLAITAELLFAAGQPHALARFITAAKPGDTSVGLAEDFANRLDRACYGYLNFPAEAVIFPDTPVFRFD